MAEEVRYLLIESGRRVLGLTPAPLYETFFKPASPLYHHRQRTP